MGLTVGIIGLPQSGKTTLFNALTRAGAQISGYPTSTVQANRAVVEVPDERLARLAEIFNPRKIVPTTVEFVDVAGLGQASEDTKKQGLSAEFIGHIRNADALAVVVRCFSNPAAPHPAGSVDAERDLNELLTELTLTDLATVEKRVESAGRKAKSGDKKVIEELDFLKRLRDGLSEGKTVADMSFSTPEQAVLRELFLLTMKLRFYVVNVSEDALAEAGTLLAGDAPAPEGGELACVAAVRARARAEGAEVVAVSAKLEAELGELPPEDAAEYLGALGLPELGADRVVQAGYRALNLISFLTAGEDEVRAWTVTRGSKAPVAAGKIHTDFERGFIRAEVVHYDDLMADSGSMKTAREHGHIRLEGKDYVVRDGDIIEFRFNVSR
ncbi:MAG: GTP-binding and nucleic acid-binding protein YchF [Ktedonobacterales bacterium]|jgi:GTP-binding protein YchF|nr:MAG: GTP-binding and nucleic acid-binding protein YchF [Ktedonobacterales bacterium]